MTIDFRVGDAEVLLFDAHSVDAVISTFGVMFVSNPGAAVAELARVCKRGGRLGLATWPADGTVAGLFKIMQPYMRGVEAWSKQTVSTLRLDEKWISLPESAPKTKLGGHYRADARPLHLRPR